jgi:hypothetical protein
LKLNLFGINKNSVIAVLIACAISLLSLYLKVNKDSLWKLYIQLQEQLNPKYHNEELDKKFRGDEKLLNFLVTTTVDKALDNYNQQIGYDGKVRLSKPTYTEKPVDTSVCYTDDCKSLGGEMRLCAPWVADCPKNNGI